ncbi:hypothetical protein [Spirosoma aerophilum]|jgi:quinolinate synthase
MAKSAEELIPLLRNAQNVIILAKDYQTGHIITMLRNMGDQTKMTIRGASTKPVADLVRIAQNAPPGTVTFDFS